MTFDCGITVKFFSGGIFIHDRSQIAIEIFINDQIQVIKSKLTLHWDMNVSGHFVVKQNEIERIARHTHFTSTLFVSHVVRHRFAMRSI